MNILFIISSLKHGGAEKQTVIDANLFSDNHNVVFVTFIDGELRELLNSKVKLIVLEKKGYLSTAKKLRDIIIKENIQVVNSSLFSAMIISCIAAKKINVPVFWYFHSHEYDIKLKSRVAFNHYSRYDCLKKIFFVSNELKESLIKKDFHFPENKIEVLYNSFTVKPEYDSKKNTNQKVTIGFLGRLTGLKRVDYLIDLAVYLKKNKIQNFQINIVGDGEDKESLKVKAKENGVIDNINFLGFQSDVDTQYNNFDLFILPSREECLSIALIDACTKGLPSIAFDIGGNNEIIENDKTGYLVSNKNDLLEKTKILILDCEKRRELGQNAYKYCAEKFNIKRRKKYLENIFSNLK